MYQKAEGLILRQTEYRDSDTLLTVLLRGQGLTTLKARGVRSARSRLRGACQLFCYAEFTYFDYRGYATINEAQPIEQFIPLRTQLERLSLASYVAEVVQMVSQEDVQSDTLLSLSLNTLYALCYLSLPLAQVKAAFELRVACHAGYEPDLSGCQICGSDAPDCFDVTHGMLVCSGCAVDTGLRLPVGEGARSALRYIVHQPLKRLFSFRLSDTALQQLAEVSEAYLLTRLERGFPALDYFKSLTYQADITT